MAGAVGFKPTPEGFGGLYAIITPYPYINCYFLYNTESTIQLIANPKI